MTSLPDKPLSAAEQMREEAALQCEDALDTSAGEIYVLSRAARNIRALPLPPDPVRDALVEALVEMQSLINGATGEIIDYLTPGGTDGPDLINQLITRFDGPEQRAVFAKARAALALAGERT